MQRKWYIPRNFAIPEEKLTGLLRDILARAPQSGTLFDKMWNACLDIADQVYDTDFFKGIRNGKLDPNAYGGLMVQDAYYCFRAQDDYEAASTHAYDDACRQFLDKKHDSYVEYNAYYHDTWHVRETSGVIPGTDIYNYAELEATVASHEISPYVFVVMLPCEYLWTWVANRCLGDKATDPDSLYHFWIDGNHGEARGATQMELILETYRDKVDEDKAMRIFRQAMESELRVFTSATILNSEYYEK